jgi:hypothetical protein
MDDAMRVSVRTILYAVVTMFAVVSGGQAEQAGRIVAAHVLDKNSMVKWGLRPTA